jgi:tetratricopeptide (TPR) repeat protein
MIFSFIWKASKAFFRILKRFEISKILILMVISAAVLIFSFTQIQKLAADYFFRQIQVADSSRNMPLALLAYNYLEKLLSGHSSYYDEVTGYMLANQILESPLVVGNFSLEDLEKIKDKIKPHSFFSRLSQARLHTVLAAREDLKAQAEVKKEWEELIKTSPQFPKLYYDFGRFLEKQGQYGKAIEEWQTGLEFLPEISDPRLSREHRQAVEKERARFYLAMARAWQQLGKNDLAIKYYNLAFRAAPSQTTPLWQMANLYRQQGQDDKALFYAHWGWRREPINFLWPTVISLIYKDRGDEGQAEKYGEIAKELRKKNNE